jgi:hypothetical protein
LKKIFFCALLFLLFTVTAFAVETTEIKTARFNRIDCHAQFAITNANALLADANNSSELNQKIISLNGSLAVLAGKGKLAMDENNFNKQAQLVWQEIIALNEASKTGAKSLLGPKNKEKRLALKQIHANARTAFVDCIKAADTAFAQARLMQYTKIISEYETKAKTLQDKNIDISEITTIISKAKEQILTPLSDAITSNDANKLKTAMENCLFNGCKGKNFHLEAKFETAKLSAILEKIKDKAYADTYAVQWQNAQNNLNGARIALETIGTAKYVEDEKKSIWDNIRLCAKTIKDIINGRKDAGKKVI